MAFHDDLELDYTKYLGSAYVVPQGPFVPMPSEDEIEKSERTKDKEGDTKDNDNKTEKKRKRENGHMSTEREDTSMKEERKRKHERENEKHVETENKDKKATGTVRSTVERVRPLKSVVKQVSRSDPVEDMVTRKHSRTRVITGRRPRSPVKRRGPFNRNYH